MKIVDISAISKFCAIV